MTPIDPAIKILIIEDSEEDAFLLTRELSHHLANILPNRVDTLNDLNKALEKPWDLILCDFNLPEFDGLTALHLIREKGIEAPFILVSGVVEEGIAASMMRLGANDYIMKDNLKRLVPAVIRELAEAKLRNELKAAALNFSGASTKVVEKGIMPENDSAPGREHPQNHADSGSKHTELLTFIENSRKQAGQENFIRERHKAIINIFGLTI